MFAPDNQRRQLFFTKELLKSRVARQVIRVVQEEIQLNRFVAGPFHQQRVKHVAFRRHQRFVTDAMQILPAGSCQIEHIVMHDLAVFQRRLCPVTANRLPCVTQPFEIGIAVLRNQAGYPVGIRERQPQPARRAIVEHVKRVPLEP